MVHRRLVLRKGKPLQEDYYLLDGLLLSALNTQQCQQLKV